VSGSSGSYFGGFTSLATLRGINPSSVAISNAAVSLPSVSRTLRGPSPVPGLPPRRRPAVSIQVTIRSISALVTFCIGIEPSRSRTGRSASLWLRLLESRSSRVAPSIQSSRYCDTVIFVGMM
jgi:hypothetical protein